MTNHLIFDSDTKINLIGEIDFESIPVILKTVKIKSDSEITLDLQGIVNGQTVILSLLLELQRLANAKNTQLKFTNLPKNLQNIAQLNGVLKFFNS